jgi:inosine-uridine nucleoside N-ribohydrolase
MRLFLLFTLLTTTTFAQQRTQTAPRRVWFDTDLMIGLPENAPREVDDGITLIMALQQPEKIELVGISTVTYADYGYETAKKLLGWYSKALPGKPVRNVPVYRGSDSGRDTGVENDATRALADALRKEKCPYWPSVPLRTWRRS